MDGICQSKKASTSNPPLHSPAQLRTILYNPDHGVYPQPPIIQIISAMSSAIYNLLCQELFAQILNLYHKKREIMLRNSFVHIPGIGIKSEQKIWSSGIHSWDDLLTGDCSLFTPIKRDKLKRSVEESDEQLSKVSPEFFGARMPSAHHWRIFPEFRESIAYLDIETTGLYSWSDQVTTIAVYDGSSIVTYVQGQNLNEFKEDIHKYRVLVTYNGKCFDVPFLESYFGIKLNQVHIDLRYVLKSLDYTGGLKGCEKKAGIDRGDLEGVDGYFAVLLWNEYQRNKNHKALETLLAYNIQDVVNLEMLMVLSYNLKLKETPFSKSHQLTLPSSPTIPFQADLQTIDRIKRAIGSYMGWR